MGEKFLIDWNSLVVSCRQFYAYDIATKSYWEKLHDAFSSGQISILDIDKRIIDKDVDKDKNPRWLLGWLKRLDHLEICNSEQDDIIEQFKVIYNYVYSNEKYRRSDVERLANAECSDLWLVAAAKAKGYTIVTFDLPSADTDKTDDSYQDVKIPDIAKQFGVDFVNLFKMMRVLGICI